MNKVESILEMRPDAASIPNLVCNFTSTLVASFTACSKCADRAPEDLRFVAAVLSRELAQAHEMVRYLNIFPQLMKPLRFCQPSRLMISHSLYIEGTFSYFLIKAFTNFHLPCSCHELRQRTMFMSLSIFKRVLIHYLIAICSVP